MVISPLVCNLKTYVKDTNHALQIFGTFQFANDDASQRFLYTMDIKSLYTVIPHNSGLEALKYFLNKRSVLDPPTVTLTRLAELVLTLNFTLNAFSFNNEFYHQVGGVVMGSKMSPNYACLFVGYVEEQIGQQYTGTIPQLHKRYSDDVVGIACCSRFELEDYIAFVFNFHPALQFTHTISETELPFLDINPGCAFQVTASALPSTTKPLTHTAFSTTIHHIPATAKRASLTASFYALDASVLTKPTF
ncbi:uncharacterized protein [Montipora foliosa]|uniref:uncharacterized protein n=1 Tax=Montipora foliosa TaxID=591990 RepID=UPI0035F1708A